MLSVLATSAKSLSYLRDVRDEDNSFSLKSYFNDIDSGAVSWLFLSVKPSSRELTQSLVACLTELALAQLLDIGIKKNRRIWFVLDELAALGKLPALPTLMSEGRKYGAYIIAGLQSLNQLYASYGQYEGSSIFGQFGTSFFFRNTENVIARAVSTLAGTETVTRQQKNTSYGANEFRDGISYSEHEQKKPLIEPASLASLATGECYTFLPEPKVRIAKVKVLRALPVTRNQGFIAKAQIEEIMQQNREGNIMDSDASESIDAIDDKNSSPEEVVSSVATEEGGKKVRSLSSKKTKSKGRLKGRTVEAI